jgi:hypothetical protein
MEILIKGPGEAVICFIDNKGRTLMQERLRCAGSATMGARRPVSLVGQIGGEWVPLSPVLVSQGLRQDVTFDGEAPTFFTEKRCLEIGCSAILAKDAGRGRAPLLRADPGNPPNRRVQRR